MEMWGRGSFLGAGAARGESITAVPEQFSACCNKRSSSKRRLPQHRHHQTRSRIKRHLIRGACQKSRFNKPQFPCMA